MTPRAVPLIAAALVAAATAPQAFAQVPHEVARLDVLPGWRETDGTHIAGLRISLAPGWKTYWRSPGDSGIPPLFSLSASNNLAALRVAWPVPDVYYINGMMTIGYETEVILPVAFTANDPSAPIGLSGEIEVGVCEDVCIPVTFAVSGVLPPTGGPDPAIRAAIADRPMTEAEAGVGRVSCDISPIDDGLAVAARVELPRFGEGEVAVLELPDRSIWISEAETRRDGATLKAAVDMVPPEGAPFAFDRSDLRITVFADGRAVDIRGCD